MADFLTVKSLTLPPAAKYYSKNQEIGLNANTSRIEAYYRYEIAAMTASVAWRGMGGHVFRVRGSRVPIPGGSLFFHVSISNEIGYKQK